MLLPKPLLSTQNKETSTHIHVRYLQKGYYQDRQKGGRLVMRYEEQYRSEGGNINDDCPIEATLDIVGGKWKVLILFYLMQGTVRFGEFQRLIPKITQRMLTLQLRELEEDGVIHREVYRQVPPKVEYSLTEFGRSLESLLLLMRDWGVVHKERLARKTTTAPPDTETP